MSNESDHPLMGAIFFHGKRTVIIGESYVGHGPDDPSGYYYSYVDDGSQHWISAAAMPIRFTKEPLS